MIKVGNLPIIKSNQILKAVDQMDKYKLGIVCIIDDIGKLMVLQR